MGEPMITWHPRYVPAGGPDEELAAIARMLEAAGANALWGRGDDAARLVFEALERVESLSRSLR